MYLSEILLGIWETFSTVRSLFFFTTALPCLANIARSINLILTRLEMFLFITDFLLLDNQAEPWMWPELTSYSLIRPDVEWLHRHINIFCVIRPWLPWLCYRPPINVVVKSIRCSKMCFVAEDKPLRAVQYFYWSLTDSSLIVLIRKCDSLRPARSNLYHFR